MNQKDKQPACRLLGWIAYCVCILMLSCSGAMAADDPLPTANGVITGTVTTSFSAYSNLAVAGASLEIANTGLTAATGNDGQFILSNVPEQEVTLVVTAQGLADLSQTVDLSANPVAGGLQLVMAPNPSGDANNNGKVGVEDAVSILQSVAGQ